ncbi:MAG: hypothetical protein RLZ98_478, partial [Pseudomonadota bacterium]
DVDGHTPVITSFTINGVTHTQNSIVTIPGVGNIRIQANGAYSFAPFGNFNGAVPTITYTLTDGFGLTDTSTLDITVTPVNDAPSGADKTITVDEDTPYTVALADFGFSDPSDTPADDFQDVRISTLPAGTLTLSGTPVVVNQVITVADINSGNLVWTPPPNVHGTNVAHFAFHVRDDGGTANGGGDTDLSANTITFNVNDINDAPTATNDAATTDEDTPVTVDVLANDGDIDGTLDPASVGIEDPLNPGTFVTSLTVPGEGVWTVDTDPLSATHGQITFTPEANYHGPVTPVTYQVSDDDGAPVTATVSITINDINDAPTATNDAATTDEDTPVTVDVLANDGDIDGTLDPASVGIEDPLNPGTFVTSLTVPGEGVWTVDTDPLSATHGQITFTPAANYHGPVTPITYQVSDDDGAPVTATVSITINDINDPPVATDDGPVIVVPGTPTNIDVLGNDTDVENDPLSVTGIVDPSAPGVIIPINPGSPTVTLASGTVITLQPDGTLDVTQPAGSDGAETFDYIVSDGIDTDRGTVTLHTDTDGDGVANLIDIDDDNDGILDTAEGIAIVTDTFTAGPSITTTGATQTLFADGGTPVVVDLTSPTNAQANRLSFGGITGYWLGDSNGDEQITFTFDQPVTEVTIFVTAHSGNLTFDEWMRLDVNGAVHVFDPAKLTSTSGTASIVDGGTAVSSDIGNGHFNYVISVPAGITELTLHHDHQLGFPSGSIYDVRLTGDVLGGSADVDSDGDGLSDRLDIDADNDGITDNVEAQATNAYIAPTGNDDDGDGLDNAYDATVATGAAGSNGLTPVNTDGADNADYLDTDSDNDGVSDADEAGHGFTLAAIDAAGDADGDGLKDIVDAVTGFDVNDDDLTGTTFNLADGDDDVAADGSNAAPMDHDLDYRDNNAPPVANDDVLTVAEDTTLVADLFVDNGSGIDSDPNADPLTVVDFTLNGVTHPAGTTVNLPEGDLTISPAGVLTFVPAANFNGVLPPIAYTVSDGHGHSDTAAVTITVTPVNDPPVAVNDKVTTPEDTPVTIPVLGNDVDVDGDPLTVKEVDGTPITPGGPGVPVTGGTVTLTPAGDLVFTPAPNFNGSPTFTYTISDPSGATSVATVELTVTPVNDPPVGPDITLNTMEDQPVGGQVTATDVDGDHLTFSGPASGPGNGTVVVNPDGTFTYTPAPFFAGTDVFTVLVDDGNGGTKVITVTIEVEPGARTFQAVPPDNVQPPSQIPTVAETLAANGIVLDTVQGFGRLPDRSVSLDAPGIVVETVNGLTSLNGIEDLSGAGPINEVATLRRLADLSDGAFGTSFASTDIHALTGFSVRMDVAGVNAVGDSARYGQIVVDTLVRDQIIFVEISNTLDLDESRRIVDYKVLQADGRPLPVWVNQANPGLLLAEPPAEGGAIEVLIAAIHADGTITERAVIIQLSTGEVQSIPLDGGNRPASFDEQMRSMRNR